MITKEGRNPINSLTDQIKALEKASHSTNTAPEIASLSGAVATMGYAVLQVLEAQQKQISELQKTARTLKPSFLGGPG